MFRLIETNLPTVSFSKYLTEHPGAYRAAYMLYSGSGGRVDFHFIRLDSNGYWSWKLGPWLCEYIDNYGNLVSDLGLEE